MLGSPERVSDHTSLPSHSKGSIKNKWNTFLWISGSWVCYGLGREAFTWRREMPLPQHKQARLVCHELRYVNTFSPDTKGQGHRRPSVMSLPEYLAVLFINQLPADVVFFNTNSPSRALCMRSNCKCLYCFFPPLIYCSIDIYMGAQCGALLFSLLIIFTL